MKTKQSTDNVKIIFVDHGKAITEKEAKAMNRIFFDKDYSKLLTWCRICTRPNRQSFIYIHSSKEREVDLNVPVSKY
jgi:hypothetical protein